jgi:hypothetical protein
MTAKTPVRRTNLHFAIWILGLVIFALVVAVGFYSLA